MSSFPNRCQHLKVNGTQCGSPALRRNRFCFFHKRFQDERIKLAADRKRRGVPTFILPVLEDANSIQVALMQVMRALLTQQIDHKTASLLLYALQTASSNIRATDFKPFRREVVLDPRDAAATPLGQSNAWSEEDFEDDDEAGSQATRVMEALERVRKKRQEEAQWRQWAEKQYPDPHPLPEAVSKALGKKDSIPDSQLPPNLKKPASSMKPEEVRAEITKIVRERLLPAMPEILAREANKENKKST